MSPEQKIANLLVLTGFVMLPVGAGLSFGLGIGLIVSGSLCLLTGVMWYGQRHRKAE